MGKNQLREDSVYVYMALEYDADFVDENELDYRCSEKGIFSLLHGLSINKKRSAYVGPHKNVPYSYLALNEWIKKNSKEYEDTLIAMELWNEVRHPRPNRTFLYMYDYSNKMVITMTKDGTKIMNANRPEAIRLLSKKLFMTYEDCKEHIDHINGKLLDESLEEVQETLREEIRAKDKLRQEQMEELDEISRRQGKEYGKNVSFDRCKWKGVRQQSSRNIRRP
ncbi:MAG: hypothetical protein Q4G58_02875 [bacterium]|nr:hypothetical protein [bacterium]